MVGGAQFISVADDQTTYGQIPFHPDDVKITVSIFNSGKYRCERMTFGVCNDPWLFTEMAHKTLSHIPELFICIDDL